MKEQIVKYLLFLTPLLFWGLTAPFALRGDSEEASEIPRHLKEGETEGWNWKEKKDGYWKDVLPEEVYRVTRQKGTEAPFTGKYYHDKRAGVYRCSNCGKALFSSEAKFDSGSGWPSFWEAVDGGAVTLHPDHSLGMTRTEVLCGRCGAHLGHRFDDGPPPTGKRYCINSLSLFHQKEPFWPRIDADKAE